MGFDPLGTMTRRRYASPENITPALVKLDWTHPPCPLPLTWRVNPASPYEEPALRALMHSVLGRKYHFIPNVPLADIFSIDIKAFLQSYKIKPHWTGGNLFKANRKAIRRSALAALRGQIGRKAVDVLVCNTAGNIIAGLEIDGPHHGKYPYQGYDFSKSMLFRCKGIPLLRVASRNLAQWTWNTADTAKFFQELRVARTCWPVFDQNPSIATMQMHAP